MTIMATMMSVCYLQRRRPDEWMERNGWMDGWMDGRTVTTDEEWQLMYGNCMPFGRPYLRFCYSLFRLFHRAAATTAASASVHLLHLLWFLWIKIFTQNVWACVGLNMYATVLVACNVHTVHSCRTWFSLNSLRTQMKFACETVFSIFSRLKNCFNV